MPRCKKIAILSAVCFLSAAPLLVLIGTQKEGQNAFSGRVSELLPTTPLGWSLVNRAIAESDEVRAKVDELINFDDAVYVDYISPSGSRLSAYIAYWKSGAASPREVATHTPDVCWVGNGWERESGSQIEIWENGNRPIPIGQKRVFSAHGHREHVLFWHIVGGEVLSYGRMEQPPWYATFVDVFRRGLHQRREQFFIRLSAAESLDSDSLDPLMTEFLQMLDSLIVKPVVED